MKGQSVINVTLNPEASMLDEVVAIGYATVRRKDLTAATSSVGGKDLVNIPVTTAAQALTCLLYTSCGYDRCGQSWKRVDQ